MNAATLPVMHPDELKKIAAGLPHIRAIRNKIVTARRAKGGEFIITLTESISGGLLHDTFQVPNDPPGFIVTISIEGQMSSQFVPKQEFEAMYELACDIRESSQQGAYPYLPRGERRTILVVDRLLRFEDAKGKPCTVIPGGVLVPEGNGFLGINPKTFAATHSITHSREDARELLRPQEPTSRLFSSWYEIERSTGPVSEILDRLNRACGTKYQHGWLSRMRTDPSRKGERIPRNVRAYMMTTVLRHDLEKLGLSADQERINVLVERML